VALTALVADINLVVRAVDEFQARAHADHLPS
jgi:hypothetical protein